MACPTHAAILGSTSQMDPLPNNATQRNAEVRDDRQRINFSWLVKLRWGATVGQACTVACVHWLLRVPLPLLPLLGVGLVTISSNLACVLRLRRPSPIPDAALGFILLLDVCLLTVLLYFTGGWTNPFNFLYVVHIGLAAVILPPLWTSALLGLSLASVVVLLTAHRPLNLDGIDLSPDTLRIFGSVVAFTLAASFIAYAMRRITSALTTRELELEAARVQAARSEKLTSLATLAAGAAHELSTPLATIAVVAKELERHLAKTQADGPAVEDAVEDAQLIRQQVERCRSVLMQMAANAGESMGEPFVGATITALLDDAIAGLQQPERVRIEVFGQPDATPLQVPRSSVTHALRAVIKNALEAATAPEVHVQAMPLPGAWCVRVRDQGCGMDAATAARASEPFFTTKESGKGMGLGLFLTRVDVERLGGTFALASQPGLGTEVTLCIPTGTVTAAKPP